VPVAKRLPVNPLASDQGGSAPAFHRSLLATVTVNASPAVKNNPVALPEPPELLFPEVSTITVTARGVSIDALVNADTLAATEFDLDQAPAPPWGEIAAGASIEGTLSAATGVS
jgi:hypothetical protein